MEAIETELLIQKALATENTPELRQYWQKRYTQVIEQGYFAFSSDTLSLFAMKRVLTQPVTVYGGVFLLSHLDKNGMLDEVELQNTLETCVRLLDSILDCIEVSAQARVLINNYRRIGVGILDTTEYIGKMGGIAEEVISYIASFVSNCCYRASETLAEEKGVCGAWDILKFHIRSKPFEYWYNTKTGEVVSAQNIAEQWNEENIRSSDFEIVPRRNAALLAFPDTEEWRLWLDRDASAPKTLQNDAEEASIPIPSPQEKEEQPTQDMQSSEQVAESSSQQPLFKVGDLVTVMRQGSAYLDYFFQVSSIEQGSGRQGIGYRLVGDTHGAEEAIWYEDELRAVNVTDMLATLNTKKQNQFVPGKVTEVVVKVIVELRSSTGRGEILCIAVGDTTTFPQFLLEHTESFERFIAKQFFDRYGMRIQAIREVGVVLEKNDPHSVVSDYRLHIGVTGRLERKSTPHKDLVLVSNMLDVQLSKEDRILFQKYAYIEQNRQRREEVPVIADAQDKKPQQAPPLSQVSLQIKKEYSIKVEKKVPLSTGYHALLSLRINAEGRPPTFEITLQQESGSTMPDSNEQIALQTMIGSINILLTHGVAFAEIRSSFSTLFAGSKGQTTSFSHLIDAIIEFPQSLNDIIQYS